MIMKEKIYLANVSLEINIPNLRLMKFSSWLSIRSWISLDKVRKNFTLYYMEHNCKELWVLAISFPTSVLASDVVEIKAFVIVCHNIVVLLLILFIKLMSSYIWFQAELLSIR